MKVIFLAVVCIGIFFLYQITIGRAKHNFASCMDDLRLAQQDLENSVCSLKKQPLEDALACVTAVQKESQVASFLYTPLGFKNDMNLLIDTYNEECPQQKIDKTKDVLYL